MLANIIFVLENLECTYRYNQHRNSQVCDIQRKRKANIFPERKASSSWSFWLLKALLHLWSFLIRCKSYRK